MLSSLSQLSTPVEGVQMAWWRTQRFGEVEVNLNVTTALRVRHLPFGHLVTTPSVSHGVSVADDTGDSLEARGDSG